MSYLLHRGGCPIYSFSNKHHTLFLLTDLDLDLDLDHDHDHGHDHDTRSPGFYRKLGWRPVGEHLADDEKIILEPVHPK